MDEINLIDYINILIQRKRTIAVVTLVAMLVAGIFLVITPRTYESETTLLFPKQASGGLSSQLAQLTGLPLGGMLQALSGREVYSTILKSRTISKNVCNSLHLDRYDLDYKDLQGNLSLTTPKDGGLVLAFQVPTSWLKGRMARGQIKQSTAELASKIANTYVSELTAYDNANSLFMGKKNRLFIEKQLKRTKAELADAEVRLQKFQEEHPTLAPPDKSSEYADQALQITTQQTSAGVALHETEGQLARARNTWKTGAPRGISPEAVIDTPAITELRQVLARLEVKRATLLENYSDITPDVVALTQQIDKTYEKIHSEVANVISGKASSTSPANQELLKQLVLLEINSDGLKSRTSALAGAMSSIERRLSSLPAQEVEYARHLRDVKVTETVYTTLLSEHAKARVTEGQESGSFIVLDEAIVPKKHVKPRVKLTLAAALLVGVMFGILIATVQGMSVDKKAR